MWISVGVPDRYFRQPMERQALPAAGTADGKRRCPRPAGIHGRRSAGTNGRRSAPRGSPTRAEATDPQARHPASAPPAPPTDYLGKERSPAMPADLRLFVTAALPSLRRECFADRFAGACRLVRQLEQVSAIVAP